MSRFQQSSRRNQLFEKSLRKPYHDLTPSNKKLQNLAKASYLISASTLFSQNQNSKSKSKIRQKSKTLKKSKFFDQKQTKKQIKSHIKCFCIQEALWIELNSSFLIKDFSIHLQFYKIKTNQTIFSKQTPPRITTKTKKMKMQISLSQLTVQDQNSVKKTYSINLFQIYQKQTIKIILNSDYQLNKITLNNKQTNFLKQNEFMKNSFIIPQIYCVFHPWKIISQTKILLQNKIFAQRPKSRIQWGGINQNPNSDRSDLLHNHILTSRPQSKLKWGGIPTQNQNSERKNLIPNSIPNPILQERPKSRINWGTNQNQNIVKNDQQKNIDLTPKFVDRYLKTQIQINQKEQSKEQIKIQTKNIKEIIEAKKNLPSQLKHQMSQNQFFTNKKQLKKSSFLISTCESVNSMRAHAFINVNNNKQRQKQKRQQQNLIKNVLQLNKLNLQIQDKKKQLVKRQKSSFKNLKQKNEYFQMNQSQRKRTLKIQKSLDQNNLQKSFQRQNSQCSGVQYKAIIKQEQYGL